MRIRILAAAVATAGAVIVTTGAAEAAAPLPVETPPSLPTDAPPPGADALPPGARTFAVRCQGGGHATVTVRKVPRGTRHELRFERGNRSEREFRSEYGDGPEHTEKGKRRYGKRIAPGKGEDVVVFWSGAGDAPPTLKGMKGSSGKILFEVAEGKADGPGKPSVHVVTEPSDEPPSVTPSPVSPADPARPPKVTFRKGGGEEKGEPSPVERMEARRLGKGLSVVCLRKEKG